MERSFQPISTRPRYADGMRIQTLAQMPVSAYQRYISKDFNGVRGSQCAFHPSCSAFAKEELADKGLAGLKDTFYRLRRCTAGTSSERLTSFLLHAAHCPPERVSEFFTLEDPEVQKHWDTFQEQLDVNRPRLLGDEPQQGAKGLTDAMSEFFRHVHMSVHGELKPGVAPRFHLQLKREPQPLVRADRGGFANLVRSAGSTVIGAVGAGLGAVGASLGAALVGWREGLAAGSGRLPLFKKKTEDRYGVGSLSLSEPFLEKMSRASTKLDRLPGRVAETVIGGVVGGAVGLTAGVVGGGLFGAQTGWQMGRLLGTNWTDEKLSQAFPSKGEQLGKTPKGAQPDSEAPDLDSNQVTLFQRLLSQVPPSLAPELPKAKVAPAWTVVGLMDGTDTALERHEVAKLDLFKERAPEGLSSFLHIRRGPSKLRKALPWMAAAATPVALAASPVLGLGAAVGLWASLEHSFRDQENRQNEQLKTQAPIWDGSKMFDGDSIIEESGSTAPLKTAELAEMFQQRLPENSDRSVLLLSGHGRGSEGIGGYRTQTITKALDLADRDVRLGILEGCQTATLEGLTPLQGRMRYAAASQLDMDGMGLPWHHLLGHLHEMGESPEEFAQATVALVGGLPTVPSLSLLDLKALPALQGSIESLSASLLVNGESRNVQKAVAKATYVAPEGVAKMARPKRLDLAKFLDALDEDSLTEETQSELNRTRKALGRVVVANKSEAPLGGLSMEIPAPLKRGEYVQRTGFKNWAALHR